MIRFVFTAGILWVLLAFAWVPFTSYVNSTQAVDKTKQFVYNIYDNVKEKVNE